jgi:hypothetical protein
MKKRLLLIGGMLFALVLACYQPGQPPKPGPMNDDQSAPPESMDDDPSSMPDSPSEIPSEPVGIQQGLASLNSYMFVMRIKALGPNPADWGESVIEEQYSLDQDARVRHITTSESSVEEPEIEVSDEYEYTIGLDQCSGMGEDWSFSSQTPIENELSSILAEMISIVPLIDDPEFVGSETVNGILTNHFVFTLSGLGVESGAEVIANQGEYWLAQDGQYIVKYSLVMEMHASPEEIYRSEASFELSNINQPVSIAFPQACLDIKDAP